MGAGEAPRRRPLPPVGAGRGVATFPPVAARCRLWGWAEDSPRCRPLSPVGAGGVPMIRCVPARCRSLPPVGVGRRFAAFPPVGAGRGFATFPLVAARCRLWGWAEDSPRSRPLPLIRHDPARCRLWGSHGFCSETRPPINPSSKLRRPRATAGVTYRGYVMTVDGKCCSRSIHHRDLGRRGVARRHRLALTRLFRLSLIPSSRGGRVGDHRIIV